MDDMTERDIEMDDAICDLCADAFDFNTSEIGTGDNEGLTLCPDCAENPPIYSRFEG